MTERPLLTIAQVVDQFELSRATVRRGIESGKFDGAHKDLQGRWLVPVTALIAAGVKPRKTWITEVATERVHKHTQDAHLVAAPNENKVAAELAHTDNERAHEHAHRATRIAQLETELAAEKCLREAAERNAEDLRTAMRMIESSQPKQTAGAEMPAPRRRWWQRH